MNYLDLIVKLVVLIVLLSILGSVISITTGILKLTLEGLFLIAIVAVIVRCLQNL